MITQKNLISTCIAFVLCLFMFSCQKDVAVTADLAPIKESISNVVVEERGGEPIILRANLVASRAGIKRLTDKKLIEFFKDNPTCQAIYYDEQYKAYIGILKQLEKTIVCFKQDDYKIVSQQIKLVGKPSEIAFINSEAKPEINCGPKPKNDKDNGKVNREMGSNCTPPCWRAHNCSCQ